MFGRKKKKNVKQPKQLEKAFINSLFNTVYGALTDVLKTEYKTTDKNGKEIIDYEMTCRMIKTKARVALDFVANLKNEKEHDNEKEKV